MPSRIARTAATAAIASTALVALTATPAHAAGVTPPAWPITATGSDVRFTINASAPYTIVCSSMSLKFTTPASGYGPVNVSPGTPGNPSFTNCGDNYARFWVAASAGTWTWTGASGPPPAMKIGVPGGGLTLTLSGLPGCTISARPTVITLTAGGAWFRVFNAPIQAAASPSCGIPGGVLTLGFSASLSPSTVVDIT